jgi:hypothetical protein
VDQTGRQAQLIAVFDLSHEREAIDVADRTRFALPILDYFHYKLPHHKWLRLRRDRFQNLPAARIRYFDGPVMPVPSISWWYTPLSRSKRLEWLSPIHQLQRLELCRSAIRRRGSNQFHIRSTQQRDNRCLLISPSSHRKTLSRASPGNRFSHNGLVLFMGRRSVPTEGPNGGSQRRLPAEGPSGGSQRRLPAEGPSGGSRWRVQWRVPVEGLIGGSQRRVPVEGPAEGPRGGSRLRVPAEGLSGCISAVANNH